MKYQLILVRGTPGAGKSSLGRRLKKHFVKGALIEVDNVRGMLNNVNWVDEQEHLIALDAVAENAKSFLKAGISPIIIVDMFMPDKLDYFQAKFPEIDFKVISLLANEAVLEKRLTDRKEGFKDIKKGIAMNRLIKESPCKNELVMETSDLEKNQVLEVALKFLNPSK